MRTDPIQTDIGVHGFLSPEGVRLELQIAGPTLRMLAYGVDLMVVLVLMVLVVTIFSLAMPLAHALDDWLGVLFKDAFKEMSKRQPNATAPPAITGAFAILVAVLVLLQFIVETGYFLCWEMVTGGRSPGKMAMGLRVVRRDGWPIDLRSSAIRNVMRLVDILPANYFIGLVAMLLSDSG